MKITPVQNNIKSFSSKLRVFGYDDTLSQERRKSIREHLEKPFKDDDIKNSGRLSEYELGQLIKNIRLSEFKPMEKTDETCVDEELLESADFINLQSVYGHNFIYRASLGDIAPNQIQTAKRAGIKQIVKLDGFQGEEICGGIECLSFSLDNVFNGITCQNSEEEYIKESLRKDSLYEFDYSEDKIPEYIENHKQEYKIEKEYFNENFVKFIQTMQKGCVLIGCECGIGRTDYALCLDFFFNPKAEIRHFGCTQKFGWTMVNIYKNLSDEDKKAMGWDEEFDKNFINRLESYGYWVD